MAAATHFLSTSPPARPPPPHRQRLSYPKMAPVHPSSTPPTGATHRSFSHGRRPLLLRQNNTAHQNPSWEPSFLPLRSPILPVDVPSARRCSPMPPPAAMEPPPALWPTTSAGCALPELLARAIYFQAVGCYPSHGLSSGRHLPMLAGGHVELPSFFSHSHGPKPLPTSPELLEKPPARPKPAVLSLISMMKMCRRPQHFLDRAPMLPEPTASSSSLVFFLPPTVAQPNHTAHPFCAEQHRQSPFPLAIASRPFPRPSPDADQLIVTTHPGKLLTDEDLYGTNAVEFEVQNRAVEMIRIEMDNHGIHNPKQ